MKQGSVISIALLISLLAVQPQSQADDLSEILSAVAEKKGALTNAKVTKVEGNENYIIKKITLQNEALGEVTLYKRDPVNSDLAQWPTVFLLSGLGTSLDALQALPVKGLENMSVVSYSYAMDKEPSAQESIAFIKSVPKSILQIAAAYLWVEQQVDVQSESILSLNLSYGTFVAPPALRLLAEMNHFPSATVFAFGGAELKPLLKEYVDDKDMRSALEEVSRLVQTKSHIKGLRGPFLVIDGSKDEVIPRASSDSLFEYLPEPKTRIELPTEHINLDRPEVIAQTVEAIANWKSSLSN